jgi:hypothetical protein
MSKGSATASAFALALTCAGCGSWSGFGFDAGGPEMPRLRQVLALKEGMVLADVGAGKGQLTLAATCIIFVCRFRRVSFDYW